MSVEVVRVTGVSKRFTLRKQKSIKETLVNASRARMYREDFTALDGIDLSIASGESVGLVGPNGSGKSTLLKIIGGILAPSEGTVKVRGRVAALLELGAGFHPDLSGRENVYLNASILGLSREETESYFEDIVEFSGIRDFIDTQVKFYSSGMYVRLAFSVAVHVDPDVLLVDEVLAVGDEPFQNKCMAKIREFQNEGRTIIFVSHSAGQVEDLCDRVVVLEQGKMVEDNIPRIALGRLRRDYQGAMDEAAREAREGITKFPASIENVYLTDSMQSPHHADFQLVMPPGSDLVVHAELDFEKLTEKWNVHTSIERTLGGRVIEMNSADLESAPPPAEGRLPIRVTFPALMLGEGEYVVNVTVTGPEGEVLDTLNRAAMFAVRTPQRSSGFVYTDPTLAIG